MLIDKRTDENNKLEYYSGEFDSDVKEVADLLYEIINHSYI